MRANVSDMKPEDILLTDILCDLKGNEIHLYVPQICAAPTTTKVRTCSPYIHLLVNAIQFLDIAVA